MEANQVHPLLGPKIDKLSRSSLPSKLQIMNFIRFKTYGMSNKEKSGIYREVARDLISIWREAYIVCSSEECVTKRIHAKIIPLLSKVQKNNKQYTNEETKNEKLSELNEIFDIARCPCFR